MSAVDGVHLILKRLTIKTLTPRIDAGIYFVAKELVCAHKLHEENEYLDDVTWEGLCYDLEVCMANDGKFGIDLSMFSKEELAFYDHIKKFIFRKAYITLASMLKGILLKKLGYEENVNGEGSVKDTSKRFRYVFGRKNQKFNHDAQIAPKQKYLYVPRESKCLFEFLCKGFLDDGDRTVFYWLTLKKAITSGKAPKVTLANVVAFLNEVDKIISESLSYMAGYDLYESIAIHMSKVLVHKQNSSILLGDTSELSLDEEQREYINGLTERYLLSLFITLAKKQNAKRILDSDAREITRTYCSLKYRPQERVPYSYFCPCEEMYKP